MAREWTKVELYGPNNDGACRRYAIADATSASKGQTLTLTSPRTAVVGNKDQPAAGIASEEHKANEGIDEISVWTDGIFTAYNSGAVTIGAAAEFAEQNYVKQSGVGAASGAAIIGYFISTSADSEAGANTCQVRVKL